MVCLQVISVLKEFNLKLHYCTNHEKTYDKHDGTYKKAILKALKSKYNAQKKMMIDFVQPDSAADLKDFYNVALTLAEYSYEKFFGMGKL